MHFFTILFVYMKYSYYLCKQIVNKKKKNSMKKTLLLFIILLLGTTVHAQLIATIKAYAPQYCPGEVYFKDGHHESFYEIEVPKVGKSKLYVKKNKEDKGRTSIAAIDILGVKFWHEDFPEKQYVLYHVKTAKRSMGSKSDWWGVPVFGNAWGTLFECEGIYKVNKKTGDLEIVRFRDEFGSVTPTYHMIKRADKEEANLIMANLNFFGLPKKTAEVFKENQKIYDGIKSGQLTGKDIEYILNEMASGMDSDSPTESLEVIPTNVQTDSEENGTVGDDE